MKKLLIVIFIALFLIGGGTWYLLQPPKSVLSKEEKEKALETLLGRKPELTTTPVSTNWISHTSSVATFSYPESATVYKEDNAKALQSKSVLDSFYFGLSQPKVYTTVQVVSFSGNFSEYPAVGLRLSEKESYTQSEITLDQIQGVSFFKNADTVEKSAFVAKNGRVYSIVVVGYNEQDVQSFFSTLAASFHAR